MGNLNSKQRRALDCLASGGSKEQAAVVANVTLRTVNRWLAEDPAFKDAIRQASDTAAEDAARRLWSLLDKGVAAIENVLDDPEASHLIKLRAFDLMSNHAQKLSEFGDLAERVAALEDRINAKS